MQPNPKPLSIKHWNPNDKPREKLLLRGKESMTDAELIAILIGSGNQDENAVSLSQKILASVGNSLIALGKMNLKDLTNFKGIGDAKALTILTAMELGRRRRLEDAREKKSISCSNDVYLLMQPVLGELIHEEFWVLFLNNSNKVLSHEKISSGGITGTVVDVRMIFKKAIDLMCTGIILCHNHPSGGLQPSQQDLVLTQKIAEAGKVMDVKVLDHLIITENNYFSFADEGKL